MASTTKLNLGQVQHQQSKISQHCRTCTCTTGNMVDSIESRVLKTNRNPMMTSRSNNPLFTSRVHAIGENVSEDKILWFKSLSPKPKNVVIRFASPPRTLTRSMIKQMKERESRMKQKESELTLDSPVKRLVAEKRMQQSKSTNIHESHMKETNLRSFDNYTFSGSLNDIKE